MITKVLTAKNKKNTLSFFNKEELEAVLADLPEIVEVVIRKENKSRTLKQNNYMHGVVFKIISDELGYNVEEIKELCKYMFLKDHVSIHTQTGDKEMFTVKPTSSLTTVEVEEFLEQVRTWASVELGLSIPLPNEVEIH